MTDSAILAIVAIIPTTASVLTGLAIVGAQIFREGRQHRWEEQDRARLAAELKQSTADLAAKVTTDQVTLAAKVSSDHAALAAKVIEEQQRATQSRTEIAQAIAENTNLTKEASANAKEAYHEANSVNNKIASLGLARIQEDREDRHDRRASDGLAAPPIKVEVVNTPLATIDAGGHKE